MLLCMVLSPALSHLPATCVHACSLADSAAFSRFSVSMCSSDAPTSTQAAVISALKSVISGLGNGSRARQMMTYMMTYA